MNILVLFVFPHSQTTPPEVETRSAGTQTKQEYSDNMHPTLGSIFILHALAKQAVTTTNGTFWSIWVNNEIIHEFALNNKVLQTTVKNAVQECPTFMRFKDTHDNCFFKNFPQESFFSNTNETEFHCKEKNTYRPAMSGLTRKELTQPKTTL